MSKKNDDILKSLAILEQNLRDIDSARLQVLQVVQSSNKIANVIEIYESSFDEVFVNLNTVLKEIKSINFDTISTLSKQTVLFEKEVNRLTDFDFTNSFYSIEKHVVKQFEKDLKIRLGMIDEQSIELQEKIDDFKSQLTRFEKNDLQTSFNNLLKDLINYYDKANLELSKKLELTISKSDEIILSLDKHKKESETLKRLLFVVIAMITISVLLILVIK